MKQTAFIFRKDLRRLRWIVLAWCASVGARTFIDTIGADIALEGFGPQFGVAQVSAMLSLMQMLLLVVFVSRLVHDEPLVGYDAFWITRPIAPAALMAAKLAFAATFLVILPLVGNIIVAAAFGTTASDIARTIPPFVLNQVISVMLLMALAALTPSLVRFVVAIVAVIGTFVMLMTSMFFVRLLVGGEAEESADVRLPDATPAVVGGTLLVLTALAVIVYQYRNRRIGRALAIAGTGIVLAASVPTQWPWSFTPWPPSVYASPYSPSLTVSLDAAKKRVTDGMTLRRRAAPKKLIAAHAIVNGVPPGFNIRTIGARSWLELPGGVLLQSGRGISRVVASELYGGSTAGRDTTIQAVLEGARLLTKRDEIGDWSEEWPMLLNVDEEDFVRYRNQPGRLTADLDLVLERAVVRHTLPLLDGVTVDVSDAHVKIVRVIRRATGCTVLLRRSHVESLFSIPMHFDFKHTYVLVNRNRAEAVSGDLRPVSPEDFNTRWFYLPSPRMGGRGFVLQQYELEFPARGYRDRPSVDLDETWLTGSELVILEMVPAGVIRRTVTIEGFRMGS